MNKGESGDSPLDHLVIVGGGSAGWMAAAAISQVFKQSSMKITVVESSDIATVGVGEATIPPIQTFNEMLGIDEREFLRFTQGTFKLGIEFVDWSGGGESYMHPFGRYGAQMGPVPFNHYWQRFKNSRPGALLSDYSLAIQACAQNNFTRPLSIPNSPLGEIQYAYHFDAGLYAEFLKRYATENGVAHMDAKVVGVTQNSCSGYIESLLLGGSKPLTADFFIDCTGSRGVLIEEALHTGYDHWSHLLPCDSAVTVPSEKLSPLPPYTQASAREAGWQWKIPLQHRTGNGYVYSRGFTTDEKAEQSLLSNLPSKRLAEPKVVRFNTGVRRKHWNKNCLALGLSSGFLEPLESTSLHLTYEAIASFLAVFPRKVFNSRVVESFNQRQLQKFTSIRDMLIFHYWANGRGDSEFWRFCRDLEVPDSLSAKVEMYRASGVIVRGETDIFNEESWLSVLRGQQVTTNQYSPIADSMPQAQLFAGLEGMRRVIGKAGESMPLHDDYLREYLGSI